MTLDSTLRYLGNFRATLLVMSIVAFGAAVYAGIQAVQLDDVGTDGDFAIFVDGAGPMLIFCGLLVVARAVVTIAHVMALTAIGGEAPPDKKKAAPAQKTRWTPSSKTGGGPGVNDR